MNISRRDFIKTVIAGATAATLSGNGSTPAFAQKAADNRFTLGINMLSIGTPEDIEARFVRMKKLGVKEARLDWEWRKAEQTKGTYDWSSFDTLVKLAKKHNIALFPIVHYAPDWAVTDTRKPEGIYEMAPKEDAFADYAKFLSASIDRYGTSIKNWQVWNEPNNKDFWGPKPDPAAFVKLMNVVDSTLGERRKKITLVHAGLSKADHVFLWQLWEKDKDYGRLFDVMALHPYFFNPRGGVRRVNEVDKDEKDTAALGFIGSATDGGYLPKVFNVANFMALKGTSKPIWITEIGFMAGDENKNPYAVDEQTQANLAKETLRYIEEKLTDKPFGKGTRGNLAANVDRVYWFMLDAIVLPGTPEGAGDFGLYRADHTPRPQADVIKQSAKQHRVAR